MGSLENAVNDALNKMHQNTSTGKGTYGEQAVLAICEKYYQKEGGILIHSYTYKTDPGQVGNIKRGENGQLYVENLSDYTEIDVLYVSKYRVFPIEVKAYKSKEITLDDSGIYGCYKTDKSPVHQNEMHCRHLYPFLFRGLPDGDTSYIVPLVCFADECKVIDSRSSWQQEYIRVCSPNGLDNLIRQLNTPLGYRLNLQLIDNLLKEYMIKHEKYLPPRL